MGDRACWLDEVCPACGGLDDRHDAEGRCQPVRRGDDREPDAEERVGTEREPRVVPGDAAG